MTLKPTAEFDPNLVSWGGPNQARTETCSYCEQPLGEDEIPLMLWNKDGWCAEFCEKCQERYWGMIMCNDPEDDDDAEDASDPPDLGPCCICGKEDGVGNIIMLDRRAPVPGHGWGCFQCDLPMDGAVSVLCDGCLPNFQRFGMQALRFACRGRPATDGRVPIADLSLDEFVHDISKHADD